MGFSAVLIGLKTASARVLSIQLPRRRSIVPGAATFADDSLHTVP